MTLGALLCIVDVPSCQRNDLHPAQLAGWCLEAGARTVILRARVLDTPTLSSLLRSMYDLRADGLLLIVAPGADASAAMPWARWADGVHLAGHELAHALPTGRHAPWIVGRSAHLPEHHPPSPALVESLRYCTLSPVLAPSYAPDQASLGWPALADFCRTTPTPTYALGGLDGTHMALAHQAGAAGLAIMGALHHPDHQRVQAVVQQALSSTSERVH